MHAWLTHQLICEWMAHHAGHMIRKAACHCLATTAAAAPFTRGDIVTVLRQRGLVQEVTSDDLEKAARAEPLSVYCGFDPTADSLHLGNLLGIIVLAWFQRSEGRGTPMPMQIDV